MYPNPYGNYQQPSKIGFNVPQSSTPTYFPTPGNSPNPGFQLATGQAPGFTLANSQQYGGAQRASPTPVYPPTSVSPIPGYPAAAVSTYPPVGVPAYPSTGIPPYPSGTTPAYQLGAAPANPLGTAPAYPLGTTPAYPLGTAPANPLGTAPAYTSGTAPAYPARAAPTYPAGTAPAYPTGATPAYPLGTAFPSATAPGYPSAAAPVYTQCPPVNPSYPTPGGTAYPLTGQVSQPISYSQHVPSTHQPYQDIPSIKPVHCDPMADAQILRKAMKGFGTDEQAIINILSKRTSDQRQQIAQAFKTGLGRDLIKDLKSELSGHLEDVILALMTPRVQLLAKRLYNAIKGAGTNERTIVDILCTSSNHEIRQINTVYTQMFRRPLESDLTGDTSGYFRRLLVSLNSAGRSEDTCANTAMATQDAQNLYKAGEKRLGTDESAFIMVLGTRSPAQIRLTCHEYQRISGNTLETAIRKEFSGSIQMGLLAVVKCANSRAGYFAERLHESMAGLGTKDQDLIFLVVTRAEIDMENVKQEYSKRYRRSVAQDISGDTSGDYKKVLLALVGM